ncbi:bifunctional 2-polyprenyl-6-hydroxyphenol methylase/3-demethylubiquinol 3-O-methyltransferase UbiG [Gulosibacter sp. 10]|uniref:class I SAM-dependent methyltransferase n=1 Tax=Gulosibacter sp. 10 TaxID=1255570 RepID=UPI00097EF4B9|nr:class I SAM-dependent methyltransferase [Gulosibacter sp. 10]SJM61017.1 Thioredoxin reductase [Gulosibacter sp. 10]
MADPRTEEQTPAEQRSPAEYWESRYTELDRLWSGRVNRVLEDVASPLEPGRALDLGCGEGGDAAWLARRGWTTTGVDISPTAAERGRAAARELGISEASLRFEAGDLAEWSPEEPFDLVTCSFLHSWPVVIPREAILRRATGFVAPGGRLLVTSHAAAPAWADHEALHGYAFPTPESDLAALDLDPDAWEVLLAELRDREVTTPDGEPGTVVDGVVLVRRLR